MTSFDNNPLKPRILNATPTRTYANSDWIIAAIVLVVILALAGYYLLARSVPNVSPVSTEPAPAPAAASPSTLPTPAPSTRAATP